jgi:tRNA dimethylallyltransferase
LGFTYPQTVDERPTADRRESLLLVVGPTASGKSRLGLEIAEVVGGEIISADAFAVYRGLDIGTDKPDADARRRVRHHLIDVADATEVFSAGAFVEAATAAITDIRNRGITPVVVGGTHFWIRALLLGLFPSPPRDPNLVARLAADWDQDPVATFDRLEGIDPIAAAKIGSRDRQRILRALEVFEATSIPISEHWTAHRRSIGFDAFLIAPERARAELYAKIEIRVDMMFGSGLREEVRQILASGVPHDAHALKAIGYRQLVDHLNGKCDLESAIDNTKAASRKLAKRQLTWLRSLTEGTLRWLPPAEAGGTELAVRLWSEELRGRGQR